MKAYLVHNKNHTLKTFTEEYQVFTDYDKAVAVAKELGLAPMWAISQDVGTMTGYMAGDIDVSFLPIEIQ